MVLPCRNTQVANSHIKKYRITNEDSVRFKIKVTFGHKLRYEIKNTFGENFLKLCQTSWNVARYTVNVVTHEVPSQVKIYTCLTIYIWTGWRQRTSNCFFALWCHPSWCQKFLTLVWTTLAHWKALGESYAKHIYAKSAKMTLSPWIF
jgi:hypothetical protein